MNTKNNNSSITVSLRQPCTIISQYSAEYCFFKFIWERCQCAHWKSECSFL